MDLKEFEKHSALIKNKKQREAFIKYITTSKFNKTTIQKLKVVASGYSPSLNINLNKSNINKIYKKIIEEKEEETKQNENIKILEDTKQDIIIYQVTKNNSDYIIKNVINYIPDINNEGDEFNSINTPYYTIINIINSSKVKLYIKCYLIFYEKNGDINEDKEVELIFKSGDPRTSIYSSLLYNMTQDGSDFVSIIKTFLSEHKGGRVETVFKTFKQIETNGAQFKALQKYRDNAAGTCVYDGLIKKFESHKKGNGKKIYNKLIKDEPIYKKAYSQDELKTMAEDLKISITIKDLINNQSQLININKFNYYNISFINTRTNHLEYFTCLNIEPDETTAEEYETIKKEALFYIEKFNTLYTLHKTIKIKDTNYKLLVKSWYNTYNIHSFKIDIESQENEFIKKYDDKVHRIFNKNIINDNDLYLEIDLKKAYYNVINTCRIPTGSYICLSKNDKDEYLNEIEFNKQYENNMRGWYEIQIIKTNNKLNYLGFVIDSIHVIYSETLKIIYKEGADIKILNYCISPSIEIPFNDENFLKYGDNLNETKGKKEIRGYCKVIGAMMIENNEYEINIKTDNDKEFYKITELNKNQTMHETEKPTEYKILQSIERPKSLYHVAMAVHACSSSLILEAILKFDNIQDVMGVKLDSIIYKKDSNFILKDDRFKAPAVSKIENLIKNGGGLFSPYFKPLNINLSHIIKSKIKSNNGLDFGIVETKEETCAPLTEEEMKEYKRLIKQDKYNKAQEDAMQYEPLTEDEMTEYKRLEQKEKDIIYYEYEEEMKEYNITDFDKSFIGVHIVSNIILIRGKGGAGKTHAAMTTKNFNNNNIVFTSSCWDLIQNKEKEHPLILGLSNNKILGQQCEKYNIDNKKIIICDEITLNNKNDLLKIIEDNKNKIVILLGDIDNDGFYYQCSIGDDVIKPKNINNLQTVLFTKNYRFDETLNTKLDELRKIMKEETTKEELFNYVKNEFKDNFKNKSDIIFNKNNFIGITALKPVFINNICSLSREYIQSDDINDYHIYIKKTNLFNDEMRGRTHEPREDRTYKNYEAGVFKTIHSFQGRQLEKDTDKDKYKIIININSLFNYNLLYTAISRARTLEQIIIIDDRPIKKINELKEEYINADFLD